MVENHLVFKSFVTGTTLPKIKKDSHLTTIPIYSKDTSLHWKVNKKTH